MARSKRRSSVGGGIVPPAGFFSRPKLPSVPPRLSSPSFRSFVSSLEDRRQWYPTSRPAAALPRSAARLVVSSQSQVFPGSNFLSDRISFAVPPGVSICAKRKTRREVMFAKRQTRKGAGAGRRRRNEFSNIGC